MRIEELAYHRTPLGELTLRRRPEPLLNNTDVYEVKLGDEFLMSSLFTEGERALADLGLKGLDGDLDVVVGGLGLGYTAAAALENEKVRSLNVVETFAEVIDWHRKHLVPVGEQLTSDPRCSFIEGDFFRLAELGFDENEPGRLFDAVLLDIDHSPEHHLDEKNAAFYTAKGVGRIKRQIKPGGVFALWSDDQADDDFVNRLREVFGAASGHNVEFRNLYTNQLSINSVYVAKNQNG